MSFVLGTAFNAPRPRPPSVCGLRVENDLLFAVTKTEWKIFDETIICPQPFMMVKRQQ